MTSEIASILSNIATLVAGLAISVIGFFLKRTMDQLDRKADCKDLIELRADLDSKADLTAVSQLSCDMGAVQKDVTNIKQEYITKEDFFREQAKTDKKLDRIMDILLDIKGGSASGR